MGKIYKGLICDGQISVSVLDTTDVVEESIKIHHLSPVAAAALGRTLTACAFMSSCLKNEDDNLSVTIDGNGVGGQIVVCGDADLHIRGYVDNPTADLPLNAAGKLDVRSFVGNTGKITVVKNMGLKEPYTGCCHIVSGEIAEDFAAYYTYSEQQPTGIALGVKIGKDYDCVGAGGVVMQPLPDANEESLDKAEELLSHFGNISSMIETTGVKGIIDEYFSGVEFEEREVTYKCNCSRDYVDRVLLTLGKKELYDAIESDGKIEVVCHFCPQKYVYRKEDIDELLGENGERKQ